MKKFYFTFGSGHHYAGGPLNNCYTIVEAEDYSTARQMMYNKRENKWAFDYDTAEEAGVEKWNLKLVPFEKLSKQNGETY